jgi:3-oxoadipate enol-lactonase
VSEYTRPVGRFERDGAVAVEGRRLAWRALGDGPRLLLVQGYAGSADDWPPDFLAALGCSFALLAPDNRGMGDSALGDPAGVTIDSMAADLEALLDELAIDRIPVLGFSMGGFIAQALAARAPERVESLALLSTDPGGPDAVRARPADWGLLVDHSGTPRERASRMISVVFPPDVAPRFDRELGELVAASQAMLDPSALAAQERAMAQWWAASPSAKGLPGIEPVLIGHGAEDVVIPAANAQLLAARFPGARIELFADAGHAFPAQRPDATADSIASRLRA